MVGLVYLLRTGSDRGSPPCPQRKGNLGPVFLTELNTDRVCEKLQVRYALRAAVAVATGLCCFGYGPLFVATVLRPFAVPAAPPLLPRLPQFWKVSQTTKPYPFWLKPSQDA